MKQSRLISKTVSEVMEIIRKEFRSRRSAPGNPLMIGCVKFPRKRAVAHQKTSELTAGYPFNKPEQLQLLRFA